MQTLTDHNLRVKLNEFPCCFNLVCAEKITLTRFKSVQHNLLAELDIDVVDSDSELIRKKNLLSWIYFRLERHDDSIELSNELVGRTQWNNVATLANRCFIMWYSGDEPEATKCQNYLAKMKDKENFHTLVIEAKAEQAYYYSKLGGIENINLAINLFSEVVTKVPDNYLWKFGLGLVCRRATHPNIFLSSPGRFDMHECTKRAIKSLFEVADNGEHPLRSMAYAQLVNLRQIYSAGQFEEYDILFRQLSATDLVEKALEQGENLPSVLTSCGKALRWNNVDESIRLLEKSVQIKPSSMSYHYLGKSYIKKARDQARTNRLWMSPRDIDAEQFCQSTEGNGRKENLFHCSRTLSDPTFTDYGLQAREQSIPSSYMSKACDHSHPSTNVSLTNDQTSLSTYMNVTDDQNFVSTDYKLVSEQGYGSHDLIPEQHKQYDHRENKGRNHTEEGYQCNRGRGHIDQDYQQDRSRGHGHQCYQQSRGHGYHSYQQSRGYGYHSYQQDRGRGYGYHGYQQSRGYGYQGYQQDRGRGYGYHGYQQERDRCYGYRGYQHKRERGHEYQGYQHDRGRDHGLQGYQQDRGRGYRYQNYHHERDRGYEYQGYQKDRGRGYGYEGYEHSRGRGHRFRGKDNFVRSYSSPPSDLETKNSYHRKINDQFSGNGCGQGTSPLEHGLSRYLRKPRSKLCLNKDDENVKKAMECFKKAIELTSENGSAILDLGNLLKETGEIHEALKQFNKLTNSHGSSKEQKVNFISAYEHAGLCYIEMSKTDGLDNGYEDRGKKKLTQAVSLAAELALTVPELQESAQSFWTAFRTLMNIVDGEVSSSNQFKKKVKLLELARKYREIVEVFQKVPDLTGDVLSDNEIVVDTIKSYLSLGQPENALALQNIIAVRLDVRESDWWNDGPFRELRVNVLLQAISSRLNGATENPTMLFQQIFEIKLGICFGARDNEEGDAPSGDLVGDVLVVFDDDGGPTAVFSRYLKQVAAFLFGLKVQENLKGNFRYGSFQQEAQLEEMLKYQIVIIILGQETRDPAFEGMLKLVSTYTESGNQRNLIIDAGLRDGQVPKYLAHYECFKLQDIGGSENIGQIPNLADNWDQISYVDILKHIFYGDINAVLKLFCFMIGQNWSCP